MRRIDTDKPGGSGETGTSGGTGRAGKLGRGANRGCGLLFGLGWTAFSMVFVVFGLGMARKAWKSSAWDRVPCEVERFEIVDDRDADPPFRAAVRFHYRVEGVRHTGERLWPDKEGDDRYLVLAREAERVFDSAGGDVGGEILCRVDPEDPAEAALRPPPRESLVMSLIFAAFGSGFVLVGIGVVIATLRGKGDGGEEEDLTKAGIGGKILALGFFGVFAVAGVGIFAGMVVPGAMKYLSSRGWEQVPAEVIWSAVRAEDGDDGTTYRADIFYRYEFDGRSFASNDHRLFGGSSSGRKKKQQLVDEHPPGRRFECWVDPGDPQRAVIDRRLGWGALFALFPLPFMAVGLGGLWATFLRRKPDADPAAPLAGGRPGGTRAVWRPSRIPSQPMASMPIRLKKLGALLFGTVFWNGIVGVFLGVLWKEWQRGKVEWFLLLFLVPFVIIGLVLVGSLLHGLVGLLSPSYELTHPPRPLHPGRRAGLPWRRRGGTGEPRRLTIFLVAHDPAREQRRHPKARLNRPVHEEKVFETEVAPLMHSGSAEVEIPQEIPGHEASPGELQWKLRIVAEVPGLPDTKDEFPLVVVGESGPWRDLAKNS